NENQIKMIVEQTANVDVFTNKIIEKFFMDDLEGDYKEFQSLLVSSIEKSGCDKINFGQFKYPAAGVANGQSVVINEKTLTVSMGNLLYVIFHEIAHQYQFKKYG